MIRPRRSIVKPVYPGKSHVVLKCSQPSEPPRWQSSGGKAKLYQKASATHENSVGKALRWEGRSSQEGGGQTNW